MEAIIVALLSEKSCKQDFQVTNAAAQGFEADYTSSFVGEPSSCTELVSVDAGYNISDEKFDDSNPPTNTRTASARCVNRH